MIDTSTMYHSKLRGFPLPRRQTGSAIYGSQIFDSHKWPTALVRKVEGKPRNYEANYVWIIVFYFQNIFLTICIL